MADSVPTLTLVCIKMSSILNVISNITVPVETTVILSMKSQVTLKDQIESLVYKITINKTNFHRLFGSILKVILSVFSGVLYGKPVDFLVKNVWCRCISSYVIDHLITRGVSNGNSCTHNCGFNPFANNPVNFFRLMKNLLGEL